MLGYEDGTKAYGLLDPQKNRIMVSRDVLFEEEKKWCWEEITNGDDEQRGIFTVQILEKHVEQRKGILKKSKLIQMKDRGKIRPQLYQRQTVPQMHPRQAHRPRKSSGL